MKHFIAIHSEHTARGGHTTYTVRLYRVTGNAPKLLGKLSEQFVSQGQLTMMAMEKFKALPAKHFARNHVGAHAHTPWTLKEAGIATIHQL